MTVDMRPVVAIDLDHTLINPDTETPYPGAVEAAKLFKNRGWHVIIFTLRDNASYVASLLKRLGIPYDTINQNVPGKGSQSPKVYYDVLIDDRALPFDGSWANMVEEAEKLRAKNEGHGQRILVKRLNASTRKQEVIAEFGMDKDGKFGMIRKSSAGDALLKELFDGHANVSNDDLRDALLRLNGSRLWTEVHSRRG